MNEFRASLQRIADGARAGALGVDGEWLVAGLEMYLRRSHRSIARCCSRGRMMKFMLASEAWRSLDPVARALCVEISRRYRGPNSNNGKIPYSVREVAAALNVSRNTANRGFHHLVERGFIIAKMPSGFNVKGRTSTEWLLTEFPDGACAGDVAIVADWQWDVRVNRDRCPEASCSCPDRPPAPLTNRRS